MNNKAGLLSKIKDSCSKHSIPTINGHAREILSSIAFVTQPKKILEIGTGGGYSAAVIASTLKKDFELTSIEKTQANYKLAKKNISGTPFEKRVELINSDAVEWLKDNRKQKYNLIFVDGKKSEYRSYFELCRDLQENGDVIVFDDTNWKKDIPFPKSKGPTKKEVVVYELSKKKLVDNLKEFEEKFINDDKYQSLVLPRGNGMIVGIKN